MIMYKRIVFSLNLLCASLFVFSGNPSEAVEIEKNHHYRIQVKQPLLEQSDVSFELYHYELADYEINGKNYTSVNMGDSSKLMERGYPELPKVSFGLAVPCGSALQEIQEIEKKIVRFKIRAPLPSKGSFERNIDPQKVPWHFSEFYEKKGTQEIYPLNNWSASKPFVFRNSCGINLSINPFQYDQENEELIVIKSIQLTIKTAHQNPRKSFFLNPKFYDHPDFEALYQQHFKNMEQINNILKTSPKESIHDFGKILVVTNFELSEELAIWQEKKRQLGFESKVVTVDEIGRTWIDVKNAIKKAYKADDQIAYVLIVGDAEQVPFHPGSSGNAVGRPADPMYGLIDGDDSYPELIVGRISVKTRKELATVLNKLIKYEFSPDLEGDWYEKSMGIASREGDPTDAQRADWIRTRFLGSIFKSVDRFYEPWVVEDHVADALNEGRSFVNYTGHGSAKAWVTSGFSRDAIDHLQNKNRLPIIVSVACVNGRFDYRFGDSFAERWLKAGSVDNPIGAAAIFASSTNQAWVPPTIGQRHIATLLTKNKSASVGFLFLSGSVAVLDDGSGDAEQTFQTWHIFGDPTLQVRKKKPTFIEASIPDLVRLDRGDQLRGELLGSVGPVRAVISSSGRVIAAKTISSGESEILFTTRELGTSSRKVMLTLSGPDLITRTDIVDLVGNSDSF